MSSTKSRHLAVPFGIALLAGVAAAHAVNVATPSFAAAIAPAPSSTPASTGAAPVVHAESHPVSHSVVASPATPAEASNAAPASRLTDEAARTGAIAAAGAPAPSASAAGASVAAAVGDTHLTLHDIDELARSKLTRALRGDGDTPASGAAVTLKTPVPAAPVAAPAPMVQPFVARERTTPVTFVGAYTDSAGQHVLYQFNGAVYPARVGEKLLNGWIARRVDGLSVVVAQGKHSWSVPMSGGTQESTGSPYIAGSALGDLSSPLPPGVSLAQPIARFGR
ncbi:hypothetical protein SB783_35015 [Paraburkholderia sp. SIMBA_009]|uniref:hypothetical protein n=1 Tax=Paraburkholderia tropica TaxID=92647 RepID=UPI0011B3C412|nr:hypothetical protein [Paraburkholderia tropica]